MMIVTMDGVPNHRIVETFGIVRGSTVRGTNIGRDILALLRNLVGGEITEYTKMIAESREQALDRMSEEAAKCGANAVVGVKFSTSSVSAGAAEILVYGTAVRIEPGADPQLEAPQPG